MKRKGVSPVIATVILIVIVIVLATIVFLWARGFIEERAQKFERAVELSCPDVNFEAGIAAGEGDCSGFTLDVINRGNVPIYGFKVKTVELGTIEVEEVLGSTITVGESTTICLGNSVSSGEELLIVPIILGQADSGKVAHTCEDISGSTAFVP